MQKLLKIILRTALLLGIVIFLFFAGLLIFATLTEYIPPPFNSAEANIKGKHINPEKKTFSVLSWNIGYAGLGKGMDFFYDGGKRSIPDQHDFTLALKGIFNTLAVFDTLDFIFIQEIDRKSKRTYYTDLLSELTKIFPDFYFAFGKNYDCRFVPLPLWKPMGRVVSGLSIFTPFQPDRAEVVSLNTDFPWPQRTVMLKRCILALKYRIGEKELILVNLHNSAYDIKGEIRKKELKRLQNYILDSYHHGNWVIIGGDWNDNPYGFDPSRITTGDVTFMIQNRFHENFLSGWKYVYDPTVPSNRNVDSRYIKGKTPVTTIDFFLVSPNIGVKSNKTISMEFEYSDHNPLLMEFELK